MFKDSDVQCWKYVDDLSLLECRKATNQPKIQEVVNELEKWTKDNSMKLNPSKCVVMNIQFMRNQAIVPKVKIGDLEISEVQLVKLLGVFVQKDLKWSYHVTEMVKAASMRLHMMRILKGFRLPVEDLKVVYCSYVRPKVEYCAPVWHSGLTRADKKLIERIQKRACCLMLGQRYTSYDDALNVLDLPTLEERRERLTKKFASNLTKETSPFYHWLPLRELPALPATCATLKTIRK